MLSSEEKLGRLSRHGSPDWWILETCITYDCQEMES